MLPVIRSGNVGGRSLSKLVLFTELRGELRDRSSEFFPCTLQDEISFSRRIGELVLVANTSSLFTHGYCAQGILKEFRNDPTGNTTACLARLRSFPSAIALIEQPPATARMAELSDQQYSRIISAVLYPGEVSDLSGEDTFSVSIKDFSEQLRRQQAGRCSFSGIPTQDGAAYIIRPVQQGGIWHASNFLFLDREPGEQFAAFGWTLGPALEILLNASAIIPGLAETVPQGGKLALGAAISATPDEDAVAWHRAQFLARLRGEKRR